MKTAIIAGVQVICTPEQYDILNTASVKFNGHGLSHIEELREDEEITETISFDTLNSPQDDNEELNVCYWGENGTMGNEESDREALKDYGVYFSTLIFLDGCETYFRSSEEDFEEYLNEE